MIALRHLLLIHERLQVKSTIPEQILLLIRQLRRRLRLIQEIQTAPLTDLIS